MKIKRLLSVLSFAIIATTASAQAVDINGGSSWNGWQLNGTSNTLGFYGGGSTANVYEIYTTQFTFNNHNVTGSPGGSTGFTTPLTPGAFQNGNRILGVGIRHISGSTSITGGAIVRFDLDNNSYSAASSVGGNDGQVSSTLFASQGDFNCQFFAAGVLPTTFVVFGGTGNFVSAGNQTGNHAFRGFSQSSTGVSYQMFFDLTAIPTVYDTGVFQAPYTVGTIGQTYTMSIRGFGNTDSVVSIVSPITPFCFGDGTGSACPCSNEATPGSGTGCLNSLGTGGLLTASGTASLANDTLVLLGSGMPNSFALYLQGTQSGSGAGTAFGDGKMCLNGSLERLGTFSNAAGASSVPNGGSPTPVSVRGGVLTTGIRTYQVYYRDTATFCTADQFNLSNGLKVLWTP